jgi:hypothetical protein
MGLSCGLPTIICAFFGDQGIWGQMIERHGCGKMMMVASGTVTTTSLHEAFEYCELPEVKKSASALGKKLSQEVAEGKGVNEAIAAFHKQLPVELVACDVCVFSGKPDRPGNAVRYSKTFGVRLCPECASQVGDHAEKDLRAIDWGYASRSLIRYHILHVIKSFGKLIKRPSQGFEASGVVGVYLGLIFAVVEIMITLVSGPFYILHAIWLSLSRSYESGEIPSDSFNDNLAFQKTKEQTRDAVMEILLIRSQIENLQATLSSRFNSETLHRLD